MPGSIESSRLSNRSKQRLWDGWSAVRNLCKLNKLVGNDSLCQMLASKGQFRAIADVTIAIANQFGEVRIGFRGISCAFSGNGRAIDPVEAIRRRSHRGLEGRERVRWSLQIQKEIA